MDLEEKRNLFTLQDSSILSISKYRDQITMQLVLIDSNIANKIGIFFTKSEAIKIHKSLGNFIDKLKDDSTRN